MSVHITIPAALQDVREHVEELLDRLHLHGHPQATVFDGNVAVHDPSLGVSIKDAPVATTTTGVGAINLTPSTTTGAESEAVEPEAPATPVPDEPLPS